MKYSRYLKYFKNSWFSFFWLFIICICIVRNYRIFSSNIVSWRTWLARIGTHNITRGVVSKFLLLNMIMNVSSFLFFFLFFSVFSYYTSVFLLRSIRQMYIGYIYICVYVYLFCMEYDNKMISGAKLTRNRMIYSIS